MPTNDLNECYSTNFDMCQLEKSMFLQSCVNYPHLACSRYLWFTPSLSPVIIELSKWKLITMISMEREYEKRERGRKMVKCVGVGRPRHECKMRDCGSTLDRKLDRSVHFEKLNISSVTRKKLPNNYNSCPKMISPEKW